jgi:hypothetical protein
VEVDACGECGGDGSSCNTGCDGIAGSGVEVDACGECGGDGSSCSAGDSCFYACFYLHIPASVFSFVIDESPIPGTFRECALHTGQRAV